MLSFLMQPFVPTPFLGSSCQCVCPSMESSLLNVVMVASAFFCSQWRTQLWLPLKCSSCPAHECRLKVSFPPFWQQLFLAFPLSCLLIHLSFYSSPYLVCTLLHWLTKVTLLLKSLTSLCLSVTSMVYAFSFYNHDFCFQAGSHYVLCSPGWPWTCYVDQTDIHVSLPPGCCD